LRPVAGIFHQFRAAFDAVDVALWPLLEEQVVEDEAEVGFARAVVGHVVVAAVCRQCIEQGFDEVVEVVDLLELTAAVLIQLAVPGEDVQFLQ